MLVGRLLLSLSRSLNHNRSLSNSNMLTMMCTSMKIEMHHFEALIFCSPSLLNSSE
jgi:hypothetical protein